MSKITIDKAVLEQALSALEQINSPYWSDFVTPHIAQLREALAQPKQEPAAKVQVKMTGGNAGIATLIYEIYDPRREPLKPGDMLYASPQAQPAKPLTKAQRAKVCVKAEAAMQRDQNLSWRDALITETEQAHGIPKGTT